jgi:hypothetical protein
MAAASLGAFQQIIRKMTAEAAMSSASVAGSVAIAMF